MRTTTSAQRSWLSATVEENVGSPLGDCAAMYCRGASAEPEPAPDRDRQVSGQAGAQGERHWLLTVGSARVRKLSMQHVLRGAHSVSQHPKGAVRQTTGLSLTASTTVTTESNRTRNSRPNSCTAVRGVGWGLGVGGEGAGVDG